KLRSKWFLRTFLLLGPQCWELQPARQPIPQRFSPQSGLTWPENRPAVHRSCSCRHFCPVCSIAQPFFRRCATFMCDRTNIHNEGACYGRKFRDLETPLDLSALRNPGTV